MLKRRYAVIMLDGMWLSLRRDTVKKEVILFILIINEERSREIIYFEVNSSEAEEVEK